MVAPEKPLRVIGTRPVRPDGVDKVTGRARYGSDFTLPGLLYGRVKRSPHAHARIVSIDTSRALALPGVYAVLTHHDLPAAADAQWNYAEIMGNLRATIENVLASDKVVFHGQPVAAVCAQDLHTAEDALDLIDVEYEVLPHVTDVREAMLPSAPLIYPDLHTMELVVRWTPGPERSEKPSNIATHQKLDHGDVEAGFAEADVIIEHEYETGTAHQGYIEPNNAMAHWNHDGEITVWTSTQAPFGIRDQLAKILKVPATRVTVEPVEIGGGFGGKLTVYLEPLAALMSKRTGRPVKMVMTREEVLQSTGPTSGAYVRIKVGAKKDGRIVAGQAYLAFETGGFPGYSPVGAALDSMFGPYDIPNLRADAYEVVVNKPKVQPYRGPGAPQGTYGMEIVMHDLAERLGIDHLELRARNLVREGVRRPEGQVFGVIGAEEVLRAAQDSDHYRSELTGENRGRGIAYAFWHNGTGESSAYVSINADGTLGLVLGSVDIGGQRAALAMHLAEVMGVPYESVRPYIADTNAVGYNAATAGSRTTFATGWAVHEAGMDLRRQIEERYTKIWAVDRDQVHYEDGVLTGPDDRSMTLAQVAAELPRNGGLIQGRASVNPPGFGPAFSCHIADVEVDPDTGKVQVLRYTAIQDVGRAIHPSYVEGQIQGGVAQGIGMALSEEYVYDDQGHLRNGSLLDYRMPTAFDLPMIDTVLVEVPNPGHPMGVRGVGEAPIGPPPAAITNAIAAACGVRPTHLPASPGVLLEALQQERSDDR